MKGKEIKQIKEYKGKISRIEAERFLLVKKMGSFLLRDLDETTLIQKQLLEAENQISINAVLLTYLKEDGKIGETLLIKANGRWMIYSDQVDLLKTEKLSHPDLMALIKTSKSLNFKKTG